MANMDVDIGAGRMGICPTDSSPGGGRSWSRERAMFALRHQL